MAKQNALKTYSYNCQSYSQRKSSDAPTFCLFHAPAREILEWSDVTRLEDNPDGAQRGLNNSKVRSVNRFLDDEINSIPTAIIISISGDICSLRKNGEGTTFELTIKKIGKDLPGVVIDGQHRLLGVNAHDVNMHLNVVALVTDNDDETAFQFLVINNKAAKVPTDHIKALLAERDDEDLNARLNRARLTVSKRTGFVHFANFDLESPFLNQIDWTINRKGEKIVKPTAIETAIKELQDRRIPEFDDDDALIEYFFTIWRSIKETWNDLWNAESRLLEKTGIVCMTQYITNSIVSSYDLGEISVTDLNDVDTRVRQILKMQEKAFWSTAWGAKSLDTSEGRKIVVESLVQIARNKRQKIDWKSDVRVLKNADL
jgi:DGQHR domain-containing protein